MSVARRWILFLLFIACKSRAKSHIPRRAGVDVFLPLGARDVAPDTHQNIKKEVVDGKQDSNSVYGGNDVTVDRRIPHQDEEEAHGATRTLIVVLLESIRQ